MQPRVDLAAAIRLAVPFDWHEGVGDHFSLAVSPDGGAGATSPASAPATSCGSTTSDPCYAT